MVQELKDSPPQRQGATGAPAIPAGAALALLYARAFAEHGTRALWNIKQVERPTIAQALAITRQLRTEGNMNARRLAEEIEQAARADL
jgi:hypothetical protein